MPSTTRNTAPPRAPSGPGLHGLRLATRVLAAMVGLVLVALLPVWWITHRNARGAILAEQEGHLRRHAQSLAGELAGYVRQGRADVEAMAGSQILRGLAAARAAGGTDPEQGLSTATWTRLTESLFAARLAANPEYLQLRFIGVEDGGRELVRLDRAAAGGPVRIVPPEQLQRKGQRGYLRATLGLPPGRIYVSPVELNREHGRIEVPHVPVLRVAAPIAAAGGTAGALVLNFDLGPALGHLLAALPEGNVFLLDERGQYLVHPDPRRTFAHDLGRPAPPDERQRRVAALQPGEATSATSGVGGGRDRVSAAAAVRLAGGPQVTLVEEAPVAALLRLADSIERTVILVGLGALLLAVALAWGLSRSLTRPLTSIARAVEAFPDELPAALPVAAGGEVGVLARGFARAAEVVRHRTAELEREVAERRRAELAARRLAEHNELLAAVVESSEDAILAKDLGGSVTGWNRGAERLYGYSRDEATGRQLAELIAPEDLRDELWDILARIARGERIEHHETRRRTKDGRVLEVSLTVSPIRDAGGEIVGASAIARDVSRRKQLEAELLESQKMEALGRLAGGIAHDFNNMLAAIGGNAELLLQDLEAGEPPERRQIRADVEEIRAAADRAAQLTAQLLTFSRRQVVERGPLDLRSAIRETEPMLRRLIGEDVELTVALDGGSSQVPINRTQLDQVLINLVVNARDAMPGGGTLTLETAEVSFDRDSAQRHFDVESGSYVMLAVSDTGVGMEPEVRAHAFEPFFTTKEKGKGTGLGLSTIYAVVHECGGYVWLYSEPDKGTTVKVYFPVAATSEAVRATQPEPIAVTAGGRVLVVEDEPAVRDYSRRVLERAGYEVAIAGDACEALSAIDEMDSGFAALVSDVVMPGMAGPELAAEALSRDPRLGVVLLSGYTEQTVGVEAMVARGGRFVSKPFRPAELVAAVAAVIRQRDQQGPGEPPAED